MIEDRTAFLGTVATTAGDMDVWMNPRRYEQDPYLMEFRMTLKPDAIRPAYRVRVALPVLIATPEAFAEAVGRMTPYHLHIDFQRADLAPDAAWKWDALPEGCRDIRRRVVDAAILLVKAHIGAALALPDARSYHRRVVDTHVLNKIVERRKLDTQIEDGEAVLDAMRQDATIPA
jgi:hypothetical protein